MASGTPGTVSKVLWHFSGGPKWDSKLNRQSQYPKPAPDAFAALKAIVKSKELRLGGFREVIKVIVPEFSIPTLKGRKVLRKRKIVTVPTAPVCCLADIPIPHLSYHAQRYGKFAIGFHREAVMKAGFNPVFYTLDSTQIISSIYQGLSLLEAFDIGSILDGVNALQDQIGDSLETIKEEATGKLEEMRNDFNERLEDLDEDQSGTELGPSEQFELDGEIELDTADIEQQLDQVESEVGDALSAVRSFATFIKTFDESEFGSIYCEREWRSATSFKFDVEDIAMIVVPKSGTRDYFSRFVSAKKSSLKLPLSVPIVPWEDLIDH